MVGPKRRNKNDDAVTPQHLELVRLREEREESKALSETVRSYYEITERKLRHVKIAVDGSKKRSFVGMLKDEKVKAFIDKLKKQGTCPAIS